jgi:hypothetical protein
VASPGIPACRQAGNQGSGASEKKKFFRWWPRQESNLDLELRKLLYYPLYYEAGLQK